MKTAHWLAVVLLALMVGGLTFLGVFLGGNRGGDDAEAESSSAGLTFGIKDYTGETGRVLTTEVKKVGHQDFWFANESGKEVSVGLLGVSCSRCVSAELALAPEGWKPLLQAHAAGRAVSQPPRGLSDLVAFDTGYLFLPELPESEASTTPLGFDNAVTVRPGAVGRVRVLWKVESVEYRHNKAALWVGERSERNKAELSVEVQVREPVEVSREASFGNVAARDLAQPRKTWITCWSVTRPSFRLRAELNHEYMKPYSDPVEIGEPVPLAGADLRRIQTSDASRFVPVLSGYRIPVTLRGKAKDGTPVEWGRLRRYVTLSSPDDGIAPMEVQVGGTVLGSVTVGRTQSGVIDLKNFPSRARAKGEIVLETDVKGLRLELDPSRPSAFMKAKLSEPEDAPSGHRMWTLTVEVPPHAARGEFPRPDDPVYRDSAIYVKTVEPTPRTIRVPVQGTALE